MSRKDFPTAIELSCGPVTAVDLALYAAASGDHNPLHLDADVARAAGFDRPVVHGMLSMAYAARLFTDHFGEQGLVGLQTRFAGVALRGDTLTFRAELASVEDSVATYSLRGSSSSGTDVVTGSARARWTSSTE
jgi:acyl dehydratase